MAGSCATGGRHWQCDAGHPERPSLLQEGITCWRVATATRATLLIDAEEYFSALRAALLRARTQILIAGWDFDSRILLPGAPAGDDDHANDCADDRAGERLGPPLCLGELLGYLRRHRPGLEIHVLRWSHHPIYSRDREPGTRRRLERLGVRFHSDGAHPVAGCVHHKVVVIDDALAFCGGIDLTHHRWDSCGHEPDDNRRCDHDGKPYQPTHDTQLCVAGPCARALGDYIREWQRLSIGSAPVAPPSGAELWPPRVRVDFTNVRIGIARTLPAHGGRPALRQIEALYLHAIASARAEIYMENQYFTSTRIAQAIARQCRREPQLQGLLIGCQRPRTWIEHQTMGYGRTRFQQVLHAANVQHRVPMMAALNSAGQGIIVHSKLAMFDDRLLTIGSANLNRRSMGFDVECNLALEAVSLQQRRTLRSLRNRLLAEHLDVRPSQAVATIAEVGLANAPRAIAHSRRLAPVELDADEGNLGPVLAPLFDREEFWSARPQRSASVGTRWHSALVWFCVICYFMLSASSVAK